MGEILDNFLKVYQLANFIKHSQIQQQLEQERMAAEQEQRAYQRQMQDFQIRNAMQDVGAVPVAPIGDIAPGFGADWLQQGKKQQITAPSGTTYQVPTFEERQQRLIDMYQGKQDTEARSNVLQKHLETLDPNTHTAVQMPGVGPFGTTGTVILPNTSLASWQQAQAALRAGKTQTHTVKDEATGHEYFVIEDKTKKPEDADRFIRIDMGKTGLSTTEKTKEAINRAVGIQQATMPGDVEQSRRIAEATAPYHQRAKGELSDRARQLITTFETDKQIAIQMPDGPDKDKAKANLRARANGLVIARDNELEGGVGPDGWAYIKPRAKAVSSAAPTVKGGTDPRIGKIFVGPDGQRYRVRGISAAGKAIVEPAP